MSGFSALEDFEGDHTEIVRQKQQAKAEKEEAAAAKAQKAKLKFEELKAKAGQGAWGDSDTEDDMFASPPVRCSLPSLPSLASLSARPLCPCCRPLSLRCQAAHEHRCCACRWRLRSRRRALGLRASSSTHRRMTALR